MSDKNQNEKKKKNKELEPSFINISGVKQRMKTLPKKKFLWGPIAEGSLGLIVGPSKIGKTTIAENLAFCLAARRSMFLGSNLLSGNNRIALALLEEPLRLRGDRHIKIANTFGDNELKNIENNLLILDKHSGYITNSDTWNAFYRGVKKLNIDILVIDSLTRLTQKKISESDEASDIMRHLRMISTELSITLIVIHHTTKLYKAEFPEMDNIKGGTEIIQESDYAIGLGKRNKQLCLKTIASRYSKESEKFLLLELDDNHRVKSVGQKSEIELKKESDARHDDTNKKKLLAEFKQLAEDEDDGIVKTADLYKASKFDKRRVYEYRRRLIDDGVIKMIKKGSYKLTE